MISALLTASSSLPRNISGDSSSDLGLGISMADFDNELLGSVVDCLGEDENGISSAVLVETVGEDIGLEGELEPKSPMESRCKTLGGLVIDRGRACRSSMIGNLEMAGEVMKDVCTGRDP